MKQVGRGRLVGLVTGGLGLVAGCSSTVVVATVRSGAQPAAGVVVAMECPQAIKAGGPSELGRTDEAGHLELREPAGGRWIHDGCELLVGSRRFPVKSVCQQYEGNHCIRAVIDTDLATADGRAPRP